MIIVSNSSPLIGLAAVSCFQLMEVFFKKIYIPQEVFEEVVTRGKGRAGQKEVEGAKWIEVIPVKDKNKVQEFIYKIGIDQGEAESICLAQELNAQRAILDEIKAREYARKMGLKVIGTLGILLLAKEQGLIQNIKEKMDGLEAKAFHIAPHLYQEILKRAGE